MAKPSPRISDTYDGRKHTHTHTLREFRTTSTLLLCPSFKCTGATKLYSRQRLKKYQRILKFICEILVVFVVVAGCCMKDFCASRRSYRCCLYCICICICIVEGHLCYGICHSDPLSHPRNANMLQICILHGARVWIVPTRCEIPILSLERHFIQIYMRPSATFSTCLMRECNWKMKKKKCDASRELIRQQSKLSSFVWRCNTADSAIKIKCSKAKLTTTCSLTTTDDNV